MPGSVRSDGRGYVRSCLLGAVRPILMRMTRLELTSGEQANLAFLAAGLPLLSYYIAFGDRTFAAPFSVVLALLVASWLACAAYNRRLLSGANALVLLAAVCFASAPYNADRLLWILLGTAVMFALLIHSLGQHAAKSVTRSMVILLQLAMLPPVYYHVAVGHPRDVAATITTLLFLGGAILCNACVKPRRTASWLLSATEGLLLAITIAGVFRMVSLVIFGAMHLAPFGYFFALHALFRDATEGQRAQTGSTSRVSAD